MQPAVDPLNKLLTDTLGSANEDVNKLLGQGGINVQLIQPSEVKKGADASRLASGVLVTITYNGSTEPVLSNILNAIPVESLPSQGVGPNDEFGPPCTSMTRGALVRFPFAWSSQVSIEWPSGCGISTCSTRRSKGPYQLLPSVVSRRSLPSSTA